MSQHDLIEDILNLPDLQQYFHIEDSPERSPLRLVCTDEICAGAQLKKFGEPVEFLAARPGADQPFMEIVSVDRSPSLIEISFTYPVEGVVGSAAFERDGDAWALTSSQVAEG